MYLALKMSLSHTSMSTFLNENEKERNYYSFNDTMN
jgi:hypothetical protein